MEKILIYSPSDNPRLRYVLDFLWHKDYALTTDPAFFAQASLPKIAYQQQPAIPPAFHIPASSFLSEKDIRPVDLHVTHWMGLPVFFQGEGTVPFDFFAATFYLLSRYEEYLPHEKDNYGRYAEWNSIAFRYGFLDIPVIDYWLRQVETAIRTLFPQYRPRPYHFSYRPTFDIDIPFAFLHKSLPVQLGGIAKTILRGQWPYLKTRLRVLAGRQQDPYDNFALLDEEMKKYGFSPVFFLPVAAHHGPYDKNPPQQNAAFQQLIRQLAVRYMIGCHPSWQSGDHAHLWKQEKNFLERHAGRTITASRQHYIRMTLPHTYQNLLTQGIREDFSMGYGHINGFRAGTSKPFHWYDLSAEKTTALLVHPFCWMDNTAYNKQKDTPEKAFADLLAFKASIQKVGGSMITIMHNHYFASTPETLGYRNMMLHFWQTFSATDHGQTR